MVQRRNIGARRIAERHIVKADGSLHRHRQRCGCCGVLHAVFDRQQLDQPFGGASSALQFAPDFRQGRDTARDHDRVYHELDQRAGRHHACAHVIGADPQHADDARKDQKDHDHRHQRPRANTPPGRVIAAFGHIAELGARCRLLGEGLHGLHRPQGFGCAARRGRDPVLVFAADHPQAPSQHQDRNDHGRHNQQHQPRQLGRGQQHQHQTARKDQHVAQGN